MKFRFNYIKIDINIFICWLEFLKFLLKKMSLKQDDDSFTTLCENQNLMPICESSACSLANVNSGSIISEKNSIKYQQTTSDLQSQSYAMTEIEKKILGSISPITIDENEEITVLGQRGLWANKQEEINWKGNIPISSYKINEDQEPEILKKKSQQKLDYIQELAIRYLKPPSPPFPGEIIIEQEPNICPSPAPPLIIRQQPARSLTPEPMVIREAPPKLPKQIGKKIITISGKKLPPPPRKVIIERLAPLPNKPQLVIIERWLPYAQPKRKVIFKQANQSDQNIKNLKNVIVQWETPEVIVRKEVKYLGVVKANPIDYVQKYGNSLKSAKELPEFVLQIKTPQGLVLAADCEENVHELEGDVEALQLVNLDEECLSEYKTQLEKYSLDLMKRHDSHKSQLLNYVSDLFSQIDHDQNAILSHEEAKSLIIKFKSRLGKKCNKENEYLFFQNFKEKFSDCVSLNDLKRAFEEFLKICFPLNS